MLKNTVNGRGMLSTQSYNDAVGGTDDFLDSQEINYVFRHPIKATILNCPAVFHIR